MHMKGELGLVKTGIRCKFCDKSQTTQLGLISDKMARACTCNSPSKEIQ